MRPLRVTCTALSPIASDGHLPLDGLLADLWMRENHPDRYWGDTVRVKDDLIEADIPVAKCGRGEASYYACSFAQATWHTVAPAHWHKRSTIYEQSRYVQKGTIDLSKGMNKAYRMPLFQMMPGGVLTWYVVGDENWIATRLPLLVAIGKKHSTGHGKVVNWQVKPMDEDYSLVKDGRLMRAVPVTELEPELEHTVGHYGLRPPYWYAPHQMTVALPVVRMG